MHSFTVQQALDELDDVCVEDADVLEVDCKSVVAAVDEGKGAVVESASDCVEMELVDVVGITVLLIDIDSESVSVVDEAEV